MGEQYAIVTGPDENQVDRTLISEGLRALESSGKISVSAIGRSKYKQQIISAFKAGAGNRSFCFFSFNNLQNASADATVQTYRIPVYGVRGTSDIGRAISYACIYVSSTQDMEGLSFYSQVFDSYFLSEEEIRKLGNPLTLTEHGPASLPMSIGSDNRDRAIAVISQLYKNQETDPDGRLIIVMNDAEHSSMNLLRDIYLFLPRVLRMNIGFATNVTAETYKELIGQAMLPIQLLTMDIKVYQESAEKVNNLDPSLHIIDVTGDVSNKIDPTLREMLQEFCSIERDEQSDRFFAYAEEQVLSRDGNIPSMRSYPEILRRYLDGSRRWWENSDLDSLEALEGAYQEQKILMDDEQIRNDAISTFYLKMFPEKDYALQAANAQLELHKNKGMGDKDTESRLSRLLVFLKQSLGYGKQLDAVDHVISAMEQDKNSALKKQEKEHSQETEGLKKEHNKVLREKESKISTLSSDNSKLETTKRSLEKQISDTKKKLTETESSLANLKKEYDQDDLNRKKKALQKANENLEDRVKKGKRTSLIFGGLFGLTAVAAICAYLLIVKPEQERKNKEIDRLNTQAETEQEIAKQQISSLESELEEKKSEAESLNLKASSLESENESLTSEIATLQAQITASMIEDETESETEKELPVLDGIYSNGYTDANGDFMDDILNTPIIPLDNDKDGYDDNTGWYIEKSKRDSSGSILENNEKVGYSRWTLDESGNLISTIQDEYTKGLFELAQSGTISCYDANGDWQDDRNGASIERPASEYHTETGWLKGWMDNDQDGMMDGGSGRAVCDYKQIIALIVSGSGADDTFPDTNVQATELSENNQAEPEQSWD